MAAVAGLVLLAQAPREASAARRVTCAFSHPSYSGWCRVTEDLPAGTGSKTFCSQVLACLNDVRCLGTYCNATTIRGGWKLESVRTVPKK
jgi:hypothetical protein